MDELRCFYIYIMIRKRKEHNMNNLRRRKFNVYYWTCIVIAMCTLVLSNIEWQTILSMLLGATLLPFYTLDERGKELFEDYEEEQ